MSPIKHVLCLTPSFSHLHTITIATKKPSEVMSSVTEEPNVFIMDSGPFLDVIPTLLQYLDLKSLVNLAQTCHFWKTRIYTDFKLWPKLIELPYIGHMETYFRGRTTTEDVINAKLWSALLPPEDPKALEIILGKMALSDKSIQRFTLVEKVQFKNFIHTDESLYLTALLFPSITEISFEGNLLTIDGIKYIAASCNKLKHIEFYKCNNIDLPSACHLFNTEEHKENLERIFVYFDGLSNNMRSLSTESDIPFMALCKRCGLYYNKVKNEKEMLCLYHPGKYSGYGHSCSSYSCCGSMTPAYPSSLGCEYTYHIESIKDISFFSQFRFNDLHDGHPEYMFQKWKHRSFSTTFTDRRRLNECYEKWNNKEQR